MRARSAAARAGRRAISCSRTPQASIVGCAPCYLKSHSQGEYVFDHSWADAYDTGRRALLPQAADRRAVHAGAGPAPAGAARARRGRASEALLAAAAAAAGGAQRAVGRCTSRSSAKANGTGSAQRGFLQRTDQQFHWRNEGYAHLRGFPRLARLAQAQGGAQGARAGAQRWPYHRMGHAAATSREAHWDAFFAFYMDTGSRKWGRPYLNRKVFSLLGAAMGERCLLMHGQARASSRSPARCT